MGYFDMDMNYHENDYNYFDTALICLNGHIINDNFKRYPEFNTKHCQKCGSSTINSCQNCGIEIRGEYVVPGVISVGGGMSTPPSFCHNCGKPYPWTEEKIKALNEAISLSQISEQEKEDFSKNIPDIVAETPRTNVAALKIKMIGAKVGKEIWSAARDILVDIASETAKKTMGI